jgi:hypothetical protein
MKARIDVCDYVLECLIRGPALVLGDEGVLLKKKYFKKGKVMIYIF